MNFTAMQAQQVSDEGSPARVRVKLDGFDLSGAGKSPNQVGTGSHERVESVPAPSPLSRPLGKAPNQAGGASPVLYAPQSAKAYTLTPTFYWRAEDPQAVYTFSLSSGLLTQHVFYSAKVMGGSFTYPASAPPLMPGQSYTWSIDFKGSAATGVITIVGGAERAALDGQLRQIIQPGATAEIFFERRIWFDALDAYTRLISFHARAEYYRQRSALYDQLPQTYILADADLVEAAR